MLDRQPHHRPSNGPDGYSYDDPALDAAYDRHDRTEPEARPKSKPEARKKRSGNRPSSSVREGPRRVPAHEHKDEVSGGRWLPCASLGHPIDGARSPSRNLASVGESKQPDAKQNEAQQAGEYGTSYRRGIDDIKTLGGRAMWVASEFRLPGHPRPTTESQDIWNDDPPRDSTATSIPTTSSSAFRAARYSHCHGLGCSRSGWACRRRGWRCSHL